MIRYCQANSGKNPPCPVGWGNASIKGIKSCLDDPKEENCKYLVNENDIYFCPICGSALGMKGDQ